jgi:hypothetical protein
MEEFLIGTVVIVICALAILCLGCGAIWVDLHVFDSVPVVATVDGKEVYRGISGCMSVVSGGSTTTLVTYDVSTFLCWKKKAVYTSSHITVTGSK